LHAKLRSYSSLGLQAGIGINHTWLALDLLLIGIYLSWLGWIGGDHALLRELLLRRIELSWNARLRLSSRLNRKPLIRHAWTSNLSRGESLHIWTGETIDENTDIITML
jgi:hypothetical protein